MTRMVTRFEKGLWGRIEGFKAARRRDLWGLQADCQFLISEELCTIPIGSALVTVSWGEPQNEGEPQDTLGSNRVTHM